MFAQLPTANEMVSRTTYELTRLQNYTERWHYLVLAAVCLAISTFVVYMYRRDSVELRRGVGAVLLGLRLVALLGVLAYYLDLEKRTQSKVTYNSRVLLLVDTSQSMAATDSDSSSVPATLNRLEQIIGVLDQGKLIDQLRKKHDVVVVRFDSETNRLVSLGKLVPDSDTSQGARLSLVAQQNRTSDEPVDWRKLLVPQGTETRLGQALRQLINDERSTPVAGIVVFTDGGQNSGMDPAVAVRAAVDAKIPVFTVGVGSDRRPVNVRVANLDARARAYPGDAFTVSGSIQSEGMADRSVVVELTSRPADDGQKTESAKLEGSERITLGAQGEVIPVRFEVSSPETGRRTFRLEVKSPPDDSDTTDNQQEADIEIVDRKTRVLLVASGPARDYVFLRNQLHRDKEILVDVWLQSGQPGISQDANRILEGFPSSPQELFEYDCIVAFDPDWQQLSTEQAELLERWVGEKAGGLIVTAGPVETDQWVSDDKLSKVRGLYPVEFNRRLSLLDDSRYGSTTAWPLEFTREGVEAPFLWLADTAGQSQAIWSGFPGVYGYYEVRRAKPGATVYARYSDPEAAGSEGQPVYMADHYYGAGRVFYLGSGEVWRLRALDDGYFEQLYTKLIRHVSQGRLLAGSSHGMLLVDDRSLLGSTMTVKAQLSNAQFEPLEAKSVPLQVIRPDGTLETLQLQPERDRKGMFATQFTALQQGTYRLELAVPEVEGEVLSRRIQVKVPDLENENRQRNDALLSSIAKDTRGFYYIGAESVFGGKGAPSLVSQLPDRTKETYLAGVTDTEFEEQWMRGILFVIAGALCLEWLIRRLSKLA